MTERRYGALVAQGFVVVYAFYWGAAAFVYVLQHAPAGIARDAMPGFAVVLAFNALASVFLAAAVGAVALRGGASPLRWASLLRLALLSFGLGAVFRLVLYVVEPKN